MEPKKKYRRWLLVAFMINLLVLTLLGVNFALHHPERSFWGNRTEPVSANVTDLNEDTEYLMPVGEAVGLYIHTKGVLVLGTGKVTDDNGNIVEPSKSILESGDYIVKMNHRSIHNTSQALSMIQASDGRALLLDILRNGEPMAVTINPVKTVENVYKAGIWLRDDTQGIGTVTYINQNQEFAALGHGITDIDTGLLMDISHGMVYRSNILSVVKGESGMPGEIVGSIDYQTKNRMGSIYANTVCGIFGTIEKEMLAFDRDRALPIAHANQIQKGAAQIMCAVDGEVKTYDIEIEKIDEANKENKNLVIHITDERLLQKTNGILQGMSGSPILQNNRLVGAVTHVFINDSTRGYGIFIDKMLGD